MAFGRSGEFGEIAAPPAGVARKRVPENVRERNMAVATAKETKLSRRKNVTLLLAPKMECGFNGELGELVPMGKDIRLVHAMALGSEGESAKGTAKNLKIVKNHVGGGTPSRCDNKDLENLLG